MAAVGGAGCPQMMQQGQPSTSSLVATLHLTESGMPVAFVSLLINSLQKQAFFPLAQNLNTDPAAVLHHQLQKP